MDKSECRFLNESEPEFALVLGQHLALSGFAGKPLSDREKRRAAESWFKNNLTRFRSLLCGNAMIVAYLSEDANLKVPEIFGAFWDAIAVEFHGWPVGALSAMIVNYGLAKICAKQE